MRAELTNPAHLRELLSDETIDVVTVEGVVDAVGDAAIDPMLDVLAESDSRTVRGAVFNVLSKHPEKLGMRVLARLDDPRWFVTRNLLALLRTLVHVPADFDPAPFLSHEDARVRSQAVRLALEAGRSRESALAAALADPDEQIVRLALSEIGESIPASLLSLLVQRVVKGDHSEEVRALGVRALGETESTLALETLLSLAAAGKTLLGRLKLAPKSPVMLVALRALEKGWRSKPGAAAILARAARSRDPDVRKAVTPETP